MNSSHTNCEPKRPKPEPPVAWLLGRQLLNSAKGILLYVAYGKQIDSRDWMRAGVFPAHDPVKALSIWRKLHEGKPEEAEEVAKTNPPDLHKNKAADEQYWETEQAFWFDYISDTGDGTIATYSIAYLCLSDLFVPGDPQDLKAGAAVKTYLQRDPQNDRGVLPRGQFLFVGGDTAYHVADYMTLACRVQDPFRFAYEDLVEDRVSGGADAEEIKREPNRPLFGIPGNHDYYDQLNGFRLQFHRPVRPEPTRGDLPDRCNPAKLTEQPQLFLPGFSRKQQASYVALHLPFGWWLWGLDTEVGQIDERQKKFFRDLCKQNRDGSLIPPQKLIVATCAPTTVFGKLAQKNDGKAADAFFQLKLPQPFLPKVGDDLNTAGDYQIDPGQCRLDISGDVHHYARYWGPKPNGAVNGYPGAPRRRAKAESQAPSAASYASVVSGIGGAFHHPSETYLDEVREQVLYPSEEASTKAVARRLFNPLKIMDGGYVWLAGLIIAFTLYFAATVPQSSRQVINNFLPMKPLHLVAQAGEQITPTAMPLPPAVGLPGGSKPSDPLAQVLTQAAQEPVISFWGEAQVLKSSCEQPTASQQNPHQYFYGPCYVPWPREVKLALWCFALSLLLLGAAGAALSKKLFEQAAKWRLLQAPAKLRDWVLKYRLQLQVLLSALLALGSLALNLFGLALLKPYRTHITPFGSSMTIQYSLIWAVGALALSLYYSEFLFEKAHTRAVSLYDWTLTWLLTFWSLASVALSVWWFGRNNLPSLLISDMVFMKVLIGTLLGVLLLPFFAGGELLQPHRRIIRGTGKLLIGCWHAVLQVCVPFLLAKQALRLVATPRAALLLIAFMLLVPLGLWGIHKLLPKAGWLKLLALAWPVYLALMLALMLLTAAPLAALRLMLFTLVIMPAAMWWLGKSLLIAGYRKTLALAWLAYGALMLGLPWLITEPIPVAQWSGWPGLLPPLLAGLIGLVMSCVWFGWYLAVCFAFNGHNNEAGGASRIEEFKQFIRFRLTADGLTGYVIGIDQPQTYQQRQDLKPKLVDVFHLRVKPAAGAADATPKTPAQA